MAGAGIASGLDLYPELKLDGARKAFESEVCRRLSETVAAAGLDKSRLTVPSKLSTTAPTSATGTNPPSPGTASLADPLDVCELKLPECEDFERTSTPETASPVSSTPECRTPQAISKENALNLQQELLVNYLAPAFQRKLHESKRANKAPAAYRKAMRTFVRQVQLAIVPRYGFEATEEGIFEMQVAVDEHRDDADIYVNSITIKEALLLTPEKVIQDPDEMPAVPQLMVRNTQMLSGREWLQEELSSKRPSTSGQIKKMLRELLRGYGEPSFQNELRNLKLPYNFAHQYSFDGFYHLPGRAELALEVQKHVLPKFGFEGTRQGAGDMIVWCAGFLQDAEVTGLFDDINRMLGMSQSAAERFRKAAIATQHL